MTEPETTAAQPSFRPSKRRKVIRERRASPSDDEQAAHQSHIAEGSVAHSGIAADREESESNGAVVVQKIRKPRARLGLEVSNSSTSRIYKTGMLTSEGHDGTAEEVHSVGKRFAPQTGLVKDDLDKHMTAYVDARIAQLRGDSEPRGSDPQQYSETSNNVTNVSPQVSRERDPIEPKDSVTKARQPAGAGKLHEIDLGPDTTRRNVLRTQVAVFGGPNDDSSDVTDSKKGRRRRKRRTSEDIKRDQMVERVLSEARLDLYDTSSVQRTVTATGTDQAADERVAEEFKREFLDAQQSRIMKPTVVRKKLEGDDKILKGPKLGGSRSARAAMHASLQKSAGDSSKK